MNSQHLRTIFDIHKATFLRKRPRLYLVSAILDRLPLDNKCEFRQDGCNIQYEHTPMSNTIEEAISLDDHIIKLLERFIELHANCYDVGSMITDLVCPLAFHFGSLKHPRGCTSSDWINANDRLVYRIVEEFYLHKQAHIDDTTTPLILADALLDAGCDNALILDHLRNHPVHIPGCFVMDEILFGPQP